MADAFDTRNELVRIKVSSQYRVSAMVDLGLLTDIVSAALPHYH